MAEMIYNVNGTQMTRTELIQKILETVLDLSFEKAPVMATLRQYSIEHNVSRHAVKIAKAMMWEVETVGYAPK